MPKASLAATHRKSGVNTVVISKFSARWSHTNSSVQYDYNSLLLPRIAECNWKFRRAAMQKIIATTHAAGCQIVSGGLLQQQSFAHLIAPHERLR
jgi:hypothetical protein